MNAKPVYCNPLQSSQQKMVSAVFLTVCCICMISAIDSGFAASGTNNLDSRSNFRSTGCRNITKKLPYQVSLQLATIQPPKTNDVHHFCSGALINANVVLSAAQCLDDMYSKHLINGSMYAVFGFEPLTSVAEGTFKSLVIAGYRLRRYYGTNSGNIAVLQLEQSAPIESDNIDLIPLRLSHEGSHEMCFTSGWGTVTKDSPQQSNLYSTLVTTLPHRDCLKNSGKEDDIYIFEDNICAGNDLAGTDPCHGDAGGPLVCNGHLTGVASEVSKLPKQSLAGIFTSVYYHQQLIQRSIQIIQHGYLTEEDRDFIYEVRSYGDKVSRPTSLLILAGIVLTFFLCKFQ